MIILVNIGDISRSSRSFFISLKYYSRFFTAVGPLQVNILFQSSLGALQTGPVWVSWSFLSKFV